MAEKRRKSLLKAKMKNLNERPTNLLLIFTRNPELGKVKTRLAKDVGDQAAFDIYNFLLDHTVSVTKELNVTKEVHYSEKSEPDDLWDNKIYHKKLQQGNDLGSRMQHAFEEGFKNGFKNIIIIGSDLYDLVQEDLEAAFEALEHNELVIGPAEDGGYYLLGMKRREPQLFKNKNWGTPTVFSDTLKDLEGKNIGFLPLKNDIDNFNDLKDQRVFQQFFQHINI